MQFHNDVSLQNYSTMRLGGLAKHLIEITIPAEIPEAIKWATERQLPVMMIGGGSNIIWRDEGFPGLVLVNKITGIETYAQDEENIYLTVGAGEEWDKIVGQTVDQGFSGLEQLSLIPGTTGATPIQNVGAYGRETSEVLVSIQAYDQQADKMVLINNSDCDFSYRNSRFKSTDRGRFFITHVTFHLTKANPLPPFYSSVQAYFEQHQITDVTSQALREAVIAIRQAKLPDPKFVANSGSFFGNPIVSEAQFVQLQADFPDMPYWRQNNGSVKLAAAWLIEHCGFKGAYDPDIGIGVWEKQSLVLVNRAAQRTADLLNFRDRIIEAVDSKFGITLEQEPELLP